MSDDQFLAISIEEAAKRLGIGRNSAYDAAKRGQLPTVRFGRRMVVPVKALEKMLAQAGAVPVANDQSVAA
jgi:excisionase family DNA binding protein